MRHSSVTLKFLSNPYTALVLRDTTKFSEHLGVLASGDNVKLARASESFGIQHLVSPGDRASVRLSTDHSKSVMYAVMMLVKYRAKLKKVANQLIATGAIYPKYKPGEWANIVGAEVIEAALAIKCPDPTPPSSNH